MGFFVCFVFWPERCCSVGGMLHHKAEGLWFRSRPGHVPGLRSQAQAGCAQEATSWRFSATLRLSLPLSLKTD